MQIMENITPIQITKPIMQLCRFLCPNVNPLWVDICPEPDAIIDGCFPNVQAKILKDGGSIQYGWEIRELTGVLIEGEFHGIWASPDNKLIDITPVITGEKRILFLPDKNRIYSGVQINNFRKPLRHDKLVLDFISIHEEIYRIQNKGERKYLHGEIQVPYDEINPFIELGDKIGQALKMGLTENDVCFCGSSRKYKNCCSEKLRLLIRGQAAIIPIIPS